jgi:hypothetical protein
MMSIETDNGRTTYHPGELVEGTLHWSADEALSNIELQAAWTTRGKGGTDTTIVDSIMLERPIPLGSKRFRLRLPDQPYSFSGKLISVLWYLKAIASPGVNEVEVPLIVSPTLREIVINKA